MSKHYYNELAFSSLNSSEVKTFLEEYGNKWRIYYIILGGVNMLYDATQISEQFNITKLTADAKLELPEVKLLVINKDGKLFVDEIGLEIIKESLKYSQETEKEIAGVEAELLKDDMIKVLKANNEFLKNQLNVKDDQIEVIKKLLENNKIFMQYAQENEEKNKATLNSTAVVKEHDIELVNKLSEALERQRVKAEAEREQQKDKGFFKRLFKK